MPLTDRFPSAAQGPVSLTLERPGECPQARQLKLVLAEVSLAPCVLRRECRIAGEGRLHMTVLRTK